jgi:hypothetical protein
MKPFIVWIDFEPGGWAKCDFSTRSEAETFAASDFRRGCDYVITQVIGGSETQDGQTPGDPGSDGGG